MDLSSVIKIKVCKEAGFELLTRLAHSMGKSTITLPCPNGKTTSQAIIREISPAILDQKVRFTLGQLNMRTLLPT